MYSLLVQFQVKPDKIDDFLKAARQVRQYNRKQAYKVPVIYRPLDPRSGKYMFEFSYDSRNELQEEQQKQSTDEMWQRLMALQEATFVPGTSSIDIFHKEV
ncbi:MAG: hypothetical protein JO247_15105 [Chloroflexi bacterium]|nr:hypothetical protein [Chloroflexota bacterium]